MKFGKTKAKGKFDDRTDRPGWDDVKAERAENRLARRSQDAVSQHRQRKEEGLQDTWAKMNGSDHSSRIARKDGADIKTMRMRKQKY